MHELFYITKPRPPPSPGTAAGRPYPGLPLFLAINPDHARAMTRFRPLPWGSIDLKCDPPHSIQGKQPGNEAWWQAFHQQEIPIWPNRDL